MTTVVEDDPNHDQATRAPESLARDSATLVTTSSVLVETCALLARRIGVAAVSRFRSDVAALLHVAWIDEQLLEEALDLLVLRQSRDLSLIDAASFVVMRHSRLDDVLAFDRHFEGEGFTLRG